MGLLGDAWKGYYEQIVPRKASRVQRDETRQAYYAGAFVVLNMMKELSKPDVSEEQGVAVLHSMHTEIQAYFERMKIDPNAN